MTRLEATTGPLQPSPTLVFQRTFGPSFGQVSERFVSAEMPLRSGPRNCDQSEATQSEETKQSATKTFVRFIDATEKRDSQSTTPRRRTTKRFVWTNVWVCRIRV